MSTRKIVAINTMSQVVGKLITGSATFLISIFLARTLGVNGFGDFSKITTFVAFFYLFSDFGLNAIYLEHAGDKESQSVLFTIRTILSLILSFLAISILVFLPGTSFQGYTPLVKMGIILFIPTIFLQSMITTANAFFQKHMRYDYATYALSIGSVISLLLIVSSQYFSPSPQLLISILSLLLGTVFTVGLALLFVFKLEGRGSFFSKNFSLMKSFFLNSLPLGLTLIFNVVYFHADNIILTVSRSTFEVGIYGFAYKLFEFPLVIPTFFMNAVFPLFLKALNSSDVESFLRQSKKSAMTLFTISVFLFIVLYLCSPLLSFIRPEFSESILPFRVLLISLPVFFVTSVSMWMLVALKKRLTLLFIYGLSMVLNICLNLLFIPTHGYMASAWITVGAEMLVLFLSFFALLRHFKDNNSNINE